MRSLLLIVYPVCILNDSFFFSPYLQLFKYHQHTPRVECVTEQLCNKARIVITLYTLADLSLSDNPY